MSASSPVGYARFHDAYWFVRRQILFGILPGLVLFIVLAKIDLSILKRLVWPIYGAALLLLLLGFIPGVGVTINNSRGWLSLFGYSFQPSEFAKLAVIILLAHLLTNRQHNWSDWQTSLLPIMATVLPAVLLVLLEPDLGTTSILVVIIFFMFYTAAVPTRYLATLGLIGIVGFAGLVIAAPYRVQRITTFLHPELDPKGVGYQMNQSFLAVGSGGFWGLGFGQSRQKYQYLPEVSADSIFAIIAEENGFIISFLAVFLILFFGWRGFKIAKFCPDDFGKLLTVGVMVWFLWQSLLNIGANVGALPLTGVPLPLVSHGGSAMVAMLAAFGIVAGISKTGRLATRAA